MDQLNDWLCGWCHTKSYGFYNPGCSFNKPGMLTWDGTQTDQTGQEYTRQYHQGFKLELLGEGSVLLSDRAREHLRGAASEKQSGIGWRVCWLKLGMGLTKGTWCSQAT